MVNEELLQFIRAQGVTGMAKGEIERLLLSEGGWDQSDIDEAYNVLQPPSTTSPLHPAFSENLAPPASVISSVGTSPGTLDGRDISFASSRADATVTPILADNRDTSVLWPSSPELPASVLDEKNSPTRINLDKILPGVPGERMLAQTRLSSDEFPKLFSTKTEPTVDTTASKKESGEPFTSAVVTNEISKKAASFSPDTKSSGLLLTSFFTGMSASKTPPSTEAHPLESASPPLSSPISPTLTPATTSASPLKFDLTAFHQNVEPSPKESSSISLPNIESASVPVTDASAQPSNDLWKNASGVPSVQGDGISFAGEKKKIVAPTKRTMASDLLSREANTMVTELPTASPAEESHVSFSTKIKNEKEETSVSPAPSVATLSTSPFGDDVARWSRIKRLLTIIIPAVFILLIIGGGVFAFMKFRTPDPNVYLKTAFAQFFGVSSFSYKGQAKTDLALSMSSGGVMQNGTMRFSLDINGALANGKNSYGDGAHNFTLSGGLQWGNALLSTDVSGDIRVVGSALYVHPLSFPATTNLDPGVFKENWLKIDFSDIAEWIQLSGVAPETEEYGSFGGTSGETAFNALLEKSSPLRATGSPQEETVDGVAMTRIQVLADPASMTTFALTLYQKYFNGGLTLSEDQLLRFKGAMAKIGGDVWIDTKSGALVKIALTANFDDDIAEVHAKGPVRIEFAFPDFNKPVSINAPTAVLTLSDLRAKMDEYQKTKDMRARDQVKIDRVAVLASALESYRLEKGRYPKGLADLYSSGKLATSSINLVSLNDYFYRSYQKAGLSGEAGVVSAKSTQCLTTGKVCAFYHLGTSLEDVTNTVLTSDADQSTAILGADTLGCAGEAGRACYDVVSPAAT